MPNGIYKPCRVRRGSDYQVHCRTRSLKIRPKDLRYRLALKTLSVHIRHDADHRIRWMLRQRIGFAKLLSNWIFVRPKVASHGLIDDCHWYPAPVGLCEHPTLQQLDAQGIEARGANRVTAYGFR